jgi:hypothetical protein
MRSRVNERWHSNPVNTVFPGRVTPVTRRICNNRRGTSVARSWLVASPPLPNNNTRMT